MDTLFQQIQEVGWEILFICFRVMVILLLAWSAMAILKKMLHRLELRLLRQSKLSGEPPSETEKRLETITRLVRQAALIVLWVIITLTILKEIGVNIGPILASAGIVGLAVGFGAQNLVRDFIAGFFFILENQVRVGDVAIVNGTGGLVEKLNFRTIVLRDLGGSVHVFPNGAVTTLTNLTNDWSAYVFDIGVAYKENTDRVIETMTRVGAEMKQDPLLGPYMLEEPEIFGVDKFDNSAVVIKGRIKLAFDEAGIEIPFPHQTLYFGEASKPIEVALLEKLKGKNHS